MDEKYIYRNITLLSPWIFEYSFEWGYNREIKMVPQLITLNKGPKPVSWIPDAPMKSYM